MATQVTNYQCPACTGPLHFGAGSGKLECDYCGSIFEVADVEAMYAAKEKKADEAFAAFEEKLEQQAVEEPEIWDDASIRAFSCPSCGAEVICDETTAATSCPYCGNPTVVPGKLSGALKPDYIIPFSQSREQAIAALKKFYGGKPLLPKVFSAENHINEVKGIYVPFWLFDSTVKGDISFRATRSHTHREGDYRVITTEHFFVRRAGGLTFRNLPVDASTKMPDPYMDAIEPFHYDAMEPFSTAYLPGFLADRYDDEIAACAPRMEERCRVATLNALQNTVMGYESVIPQSEDCNVEQGSVHYALLPVWMLHTKWNGKDYLFAMNGQTGKLVGDLPVSAGRFWSLFAGISAALMLVLGFLLL